MHQDLACPELDLSWLLEVNPLTHFEFIHRTFSLTSPGWS